jgi:hypothetical protein
MPVVTDDVIGLGMFVGLFCGITSRGWSYRGSDTLSPSALIANKASAYAPPALATHMRPAHMDSSLARAAMPSHMPRAYTGGSLESCDSTLC